MNTTCQSRPKLMSALKPLFNYSIRSFLTTLSGRPSRIHSVKPKMLGECKESARLWAVISCEPGLLKCTCKFFKKSNVKAEFESGVPSFRVHVESTPISYYHSGDEGVPLEQRASLKVASLRSRDIASSTLCGTSLKTMDSDHEQYATLGGIIEIVGEGDKREWFGLTVAHFLSFDLELNENKKPPSCGIVNYDDEVSSDDSSDEDEDFNIIPTALQSPFRRSCEDSPLRSSARSSAESITTERSLTGGSLPPENDDMVESQEPSGNNRRHQGNSAPRRFSIDLSTEWTEFGTLYSSSFAFDERSKSLDWALIRLNEPGSIKPNRIPCGHDAQYRAIQAASVSRSGAEDQTGISVPVSVITSQSPPLIGMLKMFNSLVMSKGCRAFSLMHDLVLDRSTCKPRACIKA